MRRAPAPKLERIFHLACWRCPRAITNELIIAPSQHARTFTRADKHVEWLPRLPRRSSGQLVTLVAVINHPLQMTWRAAPHHSEGSLSAARSGRSSFLDGMDCPHVKVARLELWAGVSSALGSRTSACAQLLAYFVHCLLRVATSGGEDGGDEVGCTTRGSVGQRLTSECAHSRCTECL